MAGWEGEEANSYTIAEDDQHVENARLGGGAARRHGPLRGRCLLPGCSSRAGGATEPRSFLSEAGELPRGRPKVAHFPRFNAQDDSEPIETSGTRLILSLKEDADKYLDDFTLRDMLKRYSEFVSFPIELWAEKTE